MLISVHFLKGAIVDGSTTAAAGDELSIPESLARAFIATGIARSLEAPVAGPSNTELAEYVDADATLASNSDAKIPSQKAVKAYIDALRAADLAPASPTSFDDEFNGNSLDPKWSWVNQSDASVSFANGKLIFRPATGDRIWSFLLQTAPSGNWTFGAKFRMQGNVADFCSCGIAVRNSATAAHANIGIFTKSTDPGNGGIEFQEYSDQTTYVSDVNILRRGLIHSDVYFKLQKSGSNLISFYSMDGITYSQVATEAIATVLGAVDQIGLSVWSMNGGSAQPFDMVIEWFRRLA